MLCPLPVLRCLVAFGVITLGLALPFVPQFNATVQGQEKKDDKKDEKKDEGLPLKPAGKVSFTTDEGTWMSLDLSPDGQTIVFDLAGDIYTLPVAGGEAKRIIGGDLGFESQPIYQRPQRRRKPLRLQTRRQ